MDQKELRELQFKADQWDSVRDITRKEIRFLSEQQDMWRRKWKAGEISREQYMEHHNRLELETKVLQRVFRKVLPNIPLMKSRK